MNIGIDIDGVILDFENTMRTYAELYDLIELSGKGVIKKDEFSYLDRYDWTKQQRDNFINKYLIKGTRKTSFMPGVKEGFKFLKSIDCNLIIITARGSLRKETKDVVQKILDKNRILYDNVYWGINNKIEICQKDKISIMIEDNPNQALELSNNNIFVLYFRAKGNKKLKENKFLIEVSNWGEICRVIKNIISCNKII